MRYNKTFTIEQARAVVPKLRRILVEANLELDTFLERLEAADQEHRALEDQLLTLKAPNPNADEHSELRETRAKFQDSIEKLSTIQKEYEHCMHQWIDAILDEGVILRDLRTGLLDFPAQKESLDYFLCWRLSDEELDYWHLPNDGYIGRRPLAVLAEYF